MNQIWLPTDGSHDAVDGYVEMDGERWYKISDCQRMPEFFMSPVSSSDHWMFVTSRGALSAGRKNADFSLFPYYPSDKLIDAAASTGPKTIIQTPTSDGQIVNWEPFSVPLEPEPLIRRHLYKSFLGDKVVFEEVNQSLNLAFRYGWSFGRRFGFIRTCRLANLGTLPISVCVLDGIQNVLPCGLEQNFQLRFSNLGDAYKKSELIDPSQMGLFYLSSIPTDRAEASEGLRATVAWQQGLERPTILLSGQQLQRFRGGLPVSQERDVRGRRGAYFAVKQFQLGGQGPRQACWRIIANVNQDHTDVINLHRRILQSSNLEAELGDDVAENQQRLLAIVSAADGRQSGGESIRVQRHQSNVLFNVMRGGLPRQGYDINTVDFGAHVHHFNTDCFERNKSFLEGLEEEIGRAALLEQVARTGDADLHRITLEYLPFTFSRRHGDPTRPWNAFSIDFLRPDGRESLGYQGNWRDIFQNWEALSLSFPEFCRSMVFRFVNASTADGYNPYRIMKNGLEWETLDPDDPWANIGYWGDHQIIYLLKLLEWSRQHAPNELDRWLGVELFAYAQVPYRIRSYDRIRLNPQETIDYDHRLAELIDARVASVGADGKLLPGQDGRPHRVTLAEKLLVPALVKITNFVPGGGLWLNTQRPEWNDANNALVGNGLSMVTACYLRRFFAFMIDWFSQSELPDSVLVSREVAVLLRQVSSILDDHSDAFCADLSDQRRKQIVDALSIAGFQYRERLYRDGLIAGKDNVQLSECVTLFRRCLSMLDHAIGSNRRSDGLYHSYNLISMDDEAYRVSNLHEMLEGQVAVLSSRFLSAEEAVGVLDALRASRMYREDQQSYMLYPDRDLPTFLEKNSVPGESWRRSRLLQQMIAAGETSIVRQDVDGGVHFNGDFRNVSDLHRAVDGLENDPVYGQRASEDRALLADLFEQTFRHRSFTGRSGTFFAYEGLGSIYWHMVSKLCLATIENYIWAKEACCDASLLERLHQHYRAIRDGIGLAKSPQQYGAFPSDPYSHTPRGGGVQQPGMTGQVKEDILSRFAELGIRVVVGVLRFDPSLFEPSELLKVESRFAFFDVRHRLVEIPVPAGSFAYTICQVPVIYHQSRERKLLLRYENQKPVQRDQLALTESESKFVFSRTGQITGIEVFFDFEGCS